MSLSKGGVSLLAPVSDSVINQMRSGHSPSPDPSPWKRKAVHNVQRQRPFMNDSASSAAGEQQVHVKKAGAKQEFSYWTSVSAKSGQFPNVLVLRVHVALTRSTCAFVCPKLFPKRNLECVVWPRIVNRWDLIQPTCRSSWEERWSFRCRGIRKMKKPSGQLNFSSDLHCNFTFPCQLLEKKLVSEKQNFLK